MTETDMAHLAASLEDDLRLDDVSEMKPAELATSQTEPARDDENKGEGLIIYEYLNARVPEYSRLCILRKKGWENPAGDNFFRKQRQLADNADEKLSRIFYNMMRTIGQDLHHYNQAFKIKSPGAGPKRILDLCMAPGGFLATALEKNPDATALCFSLPVSRGGHESLLRETAKVDLRYLDITMLAEDMGAEGIPAEHPDADNFLPRQLAPEDKFHLVFCDGQVLRQHEEFRASYRERWEARRLTVTQLALGLEHLRTGGTMIVLLHKVESWNTVLLLRTFSKFSAVKLFKPARSHVKRSSFYMIATNVQSQSADAVAAIEAWKETWRAVTLDFEESATGRWQSREPDPHDVLDEFEDELIRLGRKIWETQADALEKSSFVRSSGK